MQRSSSARAAAALSVAAMLFQAGCTAEGPGIPSAPDVPEVRYSLEGGYTVLNAQLRPTTSDATAYGHVQLKLLPPNPVIPNEPVNVAISGVIFNSAGDDISTGAGIYFVDIGLGEGGIVLAAPLTIPSPPPIRVNLSETITISAALADELRSSGNYVVRYGSIAGSLVGGRAIPTGPPI